MGWGEDRGPARRTTTCHECGEVEIPVGLSLMDAMKAHVLTEHAEGLCGEGPITCPRPEECGICPAADEYRAKACTDDRHPVSVTSGSCPCGRFRIAGSDVAERLVDRAELVDLLVSHQRIEVAGADCTCGWRGRPGDSFAEHVVSVGEQTLTGRLL